MGAGRGRVHGLSVPQPRFCVVVCRVSWAEPAGRHWLAQRIGVGDGQGEGFGLGDQGAELAVVVEPLP